MNNKIMYAISTLLGILIGCFVGIKGNLSAWDFIKETVYALVVVYSLVDAYLKNEDKYGVFAGTVLGLLIAVSLDLFSGSVVLVTNKLVYLILCSFIGWGSSWGWAYWKPVLFVGVLGGVTGIILGLSRGCNFGSVYLPTGPLNAGLTFMQLSVVGMGLGSLYLKSFGWRYIKNHLH